MLAASALAQGAISGKVVNTAGVPLDSVFVTLSSGGSSSGSDTTDENGAFSIVPSSGTAPFTLVATETDSCRPFGDPARTASTTLGSLADNTSLLVITLDVRDFCQGTPPSGAPQPMGIVDGAARKIVIPVGGIAFVRARVPFGATDPRILLADGTRVSPPLGTRSTISSSTRPCSATTAACSSSSRWARRRSRATSGRWSPSR